MAQSEPTACSIEKADGRSRADIQGLHRPADWNPIAFVGQLERLHGKPRTFSPHQPADRSRGGIVRRLKKVDAASGIGRKESSAIVRPEFFYRDAFGQIHRKVRSHSCAQHPRRPQTSGPRTRDYNPHARGSCRTDQRSDIAGILNAVKVEGIRGGPFSGAGAAGRAISHMTPTPFSTGEMAS